MYFGNYIITTKLSAVYDITDNERIGKIVPIGNVKNYLLFYKGIFEGDLPLESLYPKILKHSEIFSWNNTITPIVVTYKEEIMRIVNKIIALFSELSCIFCPPKMLVHLNHLYNKLYTERMKKVFASVGDNAYIMSNIYVRGGQKIIIGNNFYCYWGLELKHIVVIMA